MLKRKLQSKTQSVQELEQIVQYIAREMDLSAEKFGDIYISLTEAITNAIRHGNAEDENKFIELEIIKKAPTSVAFRITDQGQGFDYQNLPDPTSDENLRACGGRGVMIMQELSDEMHFQNNGRTVELHFKF